MTTAGTETHKIFNDPIHGHIELPQLCVKIIDTPAFQRLRHIKQLGATYKVYPGASHNRFEHCLGVCHLAGKFVERLRAVQRELFDAKPDLKTPDFEISDKDALCLQVAGLCHDLGHGPLSHVFETYFIQKIHVREAEDAKKVGLPEGSEDAKTVPEDSEDVKKVPEGSKDVKKVPEGSEDVKKVPEGSEDVKKVPEGSEDVKKVPEGSEDVKKVPEGSEDAKTVPEDSEDVKKVPEGSEGVKKSKKSEKWTHEEATCDLLGHLWKSDFFRQGSVRLNDTDLQFIKELIHKSDMSAEQRETDTGRSSKKDFLYEIISNDENCVDVDKWDYFARDCYHLGFQNNFDHNRLIQFSRLIEVEEEEGTGKRKRWHICYREKEVENLYHMFYSRVILHKRACLHKTTKIIEIMYMEALEKVNAYMKFKGTKGANCEGLKISDCTSDMVAYCKLMDNIFDLIRYEGEQCSTKASTTGSEDSGNDKQRSLAFKEAIMILDDIENRKLYKFIGEAIPPGGIKYDKKSLRKEEHKVEEEIMSQLDKKLTRAEFLINILEFSYGGEGNPVDNVYFYLKSDPDKAKNIRREQVSLLLPNVYGEQVVRMYSKNLDEENVKQCRSYFEKWCDKKEMKGKWKLYVEDGHAN